MIVTIERLGHHGDGIAEGPVFAARTLPGEVVEGEVQGGRIAAPRILTPSVDRRRAPCAHYSACGGCALQHATDGFVAGWKEGVVAQALAGQGLTAPMRPLQTSPDRSRRRAVLTGKRTKSGAMVGFHSPASDVVVDVPGCLLLRPALTAALPVLHRVTIASASRKAPLSLTVTDTDGGVDLAVTGGKPLEQTLFSTLAALADEGDLARLTWESEVVAARRPAVQTLGRARVAVPPGGFLQATVEGQAALMRAVIEAVGDARRVADLFAGSGTFALPLAERAEVHAAEGSPDMIAALLSAARATPGLRPVTAEARDLFRRPLLPDELARFDAVVLDPPRAGAEAQVREIAAARVPVLAYVSCNPVTFARDARILADAGYTIDWVLPVDQFRWSPHVELAARLTLG